VPLAALRTKRREAIYAGGVTDEIDLRAALNAVSAVVQNRPRPLREFDQIYMKAGDMVMQSEFIARWADGKRLAFIGDGDAISTCTAYLHHRGILGYGPAKVVVYDFDERICQAVKRFADSERLENLDVCGDRSLVTRSQRTYCSRA
jgi:predicted methyltransferase